jgi:N-acyl-D-aspartate/D-glutamate deacylase
VDGSGADAFPASVLLQRERIIAVGPQPDLRGCREIDCTGLIIAPGFIDLHSHSDLQVLEARTEKLKQGVTAEVVGNCGFSPFPYARDASALREFGAGILGKAEGWGWPSAGCYIKALESAMSLDRAIPLVGHGSLRIAVHGLGQQALSTRELDDMCGLLEDSLDAGCAGLSTGLMYAPGSAADSHELGRLCEIVARKNKLYASHIRSYGKTLVEAVNEQIDLAGRTGCRLQISHLQAAGRKHWHLQAPALTAIESARARGVDVEFDIYPYQCGSSVLTQLLPLWALDGGIPALLDRINSGASRTQIVQELEDSPTDWRDVTISSVNSASNASLIGKAVTEVAESRNQKEAEFVLDLLAEEEGAVNMITFNQSETNLRQLITHDLCSVITDGFYVKGKPHPRLHGTYPELFGKLVRDLAWLSLPQAVHKSTAKPAARLNLKDRGLVKKGYFADLVIFNPDSVQSNSSYTDPAADPHGIAYVIKNGEIVLQGPLW